MRRMRSRVSAQKRLAPGWPASNRQERLFPAKPLGVLRLAAAIPIPRVDGAVVGS